MLQGAFYQGFHVQIHDALVLVRRPQGLIELIDCAIEMDNY